MSGASPITTIRHGYKLFKQPHKIGDTFQYSDGHYLIIGIEKFELYGHRLSVWFTCQKLEETNYTTPIKSYKTSYEEHRLVELEITVRIEDKDKFNRLELGRTCEIKGEKYKLQEYTEVSLKGTDLYLSMTARPVYPIDRNEAKAKLLAERRKKLQLEIV